MAFNSHLLNNLWKKIIEFIMCCINIKIQLLNIKIIGRWSIFTCRLNIFYLWLYRLRKTVDNDVSILIQDVRYPGYFSSIYKVDT